MGQVSPKNTQKSPRKRELLHPEDPMTVTMVSVKKEVSCPLPLLPNFFPALQRPKLHPESDGVKMKGEGKDPLLLCPTAQGRADLGEGKKNK